MSSSKRVLAYHGPVEGYIVNYVKANGWKVAATMEHADLRQEAFIVYERVCRSYPKVREPAHMMALFKTAWHRRFLDLANSDTDQRAHEGPLTFDRKCDDDGDEYTVEQTGEYDCGGYLAVMLKEAPREVQAVLALFLNAPQELFDVALASWNGPDRRKRANGCARINAMLALPADSDCMAAVQDYFR